MNPYIQSLQNHLKDKQIEYGYSDAETLLDMLYCTYSLHNPIDNEKMRHQFSDLNKILSQLTLHENNQIFELTAELCEEHSREAILAGIHVGFLLNTELSV